jgi:putative Mg2+ transporter-C (MgtC) family protein
MSILPQMPMHWLYENWSHIVRTPWREPLLASAAVCFGGLIGNERMHKEKPAGVRTMALVCLGSATFTMIGYAFTSSTGDSGRVAAQIVTGIGFLGGGVIMRGPNNILGTTTAAMIWVTAAIGVTIGSGYPVAALGLTALVLGLMKFVGQWEHTQEGGGKSETVVVTFQPERGKTLIKIEKLLVDYGIVRRTENLSDGGVEGQRLKIDYSLPAHRHVEFLNQLACMPEVQGIERSG